MSRGSLLSAMAHTENVGAIGGFVQQTHNVS